MPYIKQERRKLIDECVNNLSKVTVIGGNILTLLLYISDDLGKGYMFDEFKTLAKYMKENLLPNGDINYFLFKYAKYHIEPSYNNYKDFIGEICIAMDKTDNIKYKDEYRESAEWIRLKILAPYEEIKKEENGDV